MKPKPTINDIQKLINKLIHQDEAELEDILLATYSHCTSMWVYLDSEGLPEAEQWKKLIEAMEFLIDWDEKWQIIREFNNINPE